MEKNKKNDLLVIGLILSLITGFTIPSQSQIVSGGGNNWCWSADDVASGGGYYRCKPALKCYWVDNRVPEGEVDLCKKIEDEEIGN